MEVRVVGSNPEMFEILGNFTPEDVKVFVDIYQEFTKNRSNNEPHMPYTYNPSYTSDEGRFVIGRVRFPVRGIEERVMLIDKIEESCDLSY